MKPFIHAKNSVKKFGGKWEDYIEIHNFIDSSKQFIADIRHRALLHNSYGSWLCEKLFGVILINSDGKEVSVRDVAENHILEDCGCIPSVQDYLQHLPLDSKVFGLQQIKKTKLTYDQLNDKLNNVD